MKSSCYKFENLRYKNGIDVWKCIFLADSAEITVLNTWHRKDEAVVLRIKSENLDYNKLDWDFNITNPRNELYHHNFAYFDNIPTKFLEIC